MSCYEMDLTGMFIVFDVFSIHLSRSTRVWGSQYVNEDSYI